MAAPRREGSSTLVVPEQLGPYWLLDQSVEGRLGPRFRACLRREGRPDKLLAVERVDPVLNADPQFGACFESLMTEVANTVHPALCAVEEVGRTADGSRYLAFELVHGRSLADVHLALAARGEGLPPALVGYVANRVADGLAAAHRMTRSGHPAPVFHGDLALADVLIGHDGTVSLTGLGSHALNAFAPAVPRRGYRAPELDRGAPCDARSDVFSLGACMYELLTSTPALRGGFSTPRPQSHISRVVPRSLEPILSRALAEDPGARWSDATELGRALRRWSATQSSPGDARALAAFMAARFDGEREADEARLRLWLERVPAGPGAGTTGQTEVRVLSEPRGRSATPARPRIASAAVPAARASAPGPARSSVADFDDLAEQTPARGHLMHELAATMSGAPSPLAGADELDARDTAPDAPPPPLDAWEDQTPAHAWISSSEEEDSLARRARARRSSQPAPGQPAQPATAPVAARPVVAPLPAPSPVAYEPRRAAAAAWPRWLAPLLAAGVLAAALAAFALLRREAAPGPSTLEVLTHPAGAEVFLQGERLGTSPLRRADIPPGALTLELRKPGFEPLVRKITIAPAQVFQLDIDLTSRRVELRTEPIVQATSAPVPDARATSEPAAARRTGVARVEARRRSEDADRASRRDSRSAGEGADEARAASASATPNDPLAGLDEGEATRAPSSAPVLAVAPQAEQPPADVAGSPPPPAAPSVAKRQAPAPAPAPAVKGPSRAPVLVSQEKPRFPARARRAGFEQGTVTVEYTIDRSGAVRAARVVSAEPPGVFDDAALSAVEQWKYQPKLENGKPVETRQRFTIRFQR